MKIFSATIATGLLLCSLSIFAQENYTPDEMDAIKTMGKEAIEAVASEFAAEFGNEGTNGVAILPIQRDVDSGYFTIQAENTLSNLSDETGLQVFTRADSSLANVLSEIEWNDNYVDVMDPATVQKFGRIQGADAVAFTRIDITRLGNNSFSVRANLQVQEVETAKVLWGGEALRKTQSFYTQGQIRLYLIIGGCILAVLIFLALIRRSLKKARRPR